MTKTQFVQPYIRKFALRYLIGFAVLFMVDYFSVFIPAYTGQITDGLMAGTLGREGLIQICFKIVGIALILALGRFGWRFFIIGAARGVEYEMRNDMFRHMETLSPEFYNKNKTGDLMAYFTNDLNAVNMLFGWTVMMIFDAFVTAAMVLYRMIHNVSPTLTLYALLPMILIGIGSIYYGHEEEKRYDKKQKAFSTLSDKVQESLSGIRVIKAFNQQEAELESFRKYNDECRKSNISVEKLRSIFWPSLDFVVYLCILITLVLGGYMAITAQITLGDFIMFNTYVGMFVWPMIAVGDSINTLTQGLASLERIRKVMAEKPTIVDKEGSVDAGVLKGGIEFRHLSFHYPDTDLDSLVDISFKIEPGETFAIIGRTGSGKSTIANLLLRMYDAPEGSLFVDGKPITDYTLQTLRRNIAYVPQDNFLFSDSIENNIAFGLEDGMAPDERHSIVEAAKNACVHDNIMDFPQQYQTVVGERGTTLSGGQKQRSSIARALLRNAPVLILDDSLSAVDTDTEEHILENLKNIRKGQTTIIIAHRLSTIQGADHILVLKDGSIAEFGNHESLMRENGIYRHIFEQQKLASELTSLNQEN